jgi:hypothetical protein
MIPLLFVGVLFGRSEIDRTSKYDPKLEKYLSKSCLGFLISSRGFYPVRTTQLVPTVEWWGRKNDSSIFSNGSNRIVQNVDIV